MKDAHLTLTGLLPEETSLSGALANNRAAIGTLLEEFRGSPDIVDDQDRWRSHCRALLRLESNVQQLFALVHCRAAEDGSGRDATEWLPEAELLMARIEDAWGLLAGRLGGGAELVECPEDPVLRPLFAQLIEQHRMQLNPEIEGPVRSLERESLVGWAGL